MYSDDLVVWPIFKLSLELENNYFCIVVNSISRQGNFVYS